MASGTDNNKMILYSCWRSSCSHRVRIALNLKEFLKLNPVGYVPVLVDGDFVVFDSFAIIMYLEDKFPQHTLLPCDIQKRTINFQVANIVASSIQPSQNLAIMKLKKKWFRKQGFYQVDSGENIYGDIPPEIDRLFPKFDPQKSIEEKVSSDQKLSRINSVIRKGFTAIEKLLKNFTGRYATGDEVHLATGSDNNDNKLILYSFWRSSCAFRVQIALNFKGLKYEYKAVNLWKEQQSHPEFLKLNPVGFVPVLADGDFVVSDSFAIIMYLEDKFPQHPLLPRDIQKRTINFQVASIVSSSIQPMQNLTLLKCIDETINPAKKLPWLSRVFIRKGFTALEKLLKDHAGRYATGDEVFLNGPGGDLQLTLGYSMQTEFPILARLNETYKEIPAFREALPENQPDAPSQGHTS
ncbi:glutathione S-transferase zeta class isoform X1 [Senna tora]|uniref:glutathione transferase n=1 Tax=Senna tora TaxID=362788 RepID=A0A834XCD0_9FABA|nr:glutathione S-transferase zeta class isoform X1 [Senna tora]